MTYFKARFGSSKSHAWENLFSAPVVGRALWLAGHCRQPQLGCAAHPRARFFQFCICAIVELNVTFFLHVVKIGGRAAGLHVANA